MEADETMTVAELLTELTHRKGKAKVLVHLAGKDGRIVEGVLPDKAPAFGVGDDLLNVVYLYGQVTEEYEDEERPGD